MRIQEREDMDWTTNRNLHKKFRMKDELSCSYCGPNRGCNRKGKRHYGGKEKDGVLDLRYPSWKLATKNRKQWYPKPKTYRLVKEQSRRWSRFVWIEIFF